MEIKINPENRSKNKKILKIIAIIMLVCVFFSAIILYVTNENIRSYVDYNILNKVVEERHSREIELDSENISFICSYGNYICVLNNNILKIYNSNAKSEIELNIAITEPIFDSNNKYLLIAEKNGKKLYMVSGKNIIWQTDVEGEISNINVNKNGYVSVIVSTNTYKTVVITINPQGKEMFRTFIANAYAIDTDISNDNKFLAIAEINTEGTKTESGVRIYSIEKDMENSLLKKIKANNNQIITSIKYNDSNKLIAMYNDEIKTLDINEESTILKFDSETLFADIGLNNSIVKTSQTSTDNEKSRTITNIINTTNKGQAKFEIEAIPKHILTNKNIVAVNTGMEAYFITENAWLRKKYVSSQEIKDIVLAENIAGIVYKNKINIVKL